MCFNQPPKSPGILRHTSPSVGVNTPYSSATYAILAIIAVALAGDLALRCMSIVSAAYEDSTVPEIGHVSIDVGHVMRFDYR